MHETNATIIYLTRRQDLWIFVHSIALLWRNFCSMHRYPVLVFHDDLSEDDIAQVKQMISTHTGGEMNISFEMIRFEFPDHVSKDPSLYKHPQGHPIDLRNFGYGYRHMCRFFSGMVMNHPSLKKFKYYWRLDSDSFILSRIEIDPFKTMKDNGFVYCDFGANPLNGKDGWKYSGKEIFWARENLWESTLEFMRQKNLRGFCYDGEVYNTNLEIVDLDFFRANDYQSYFSYMDRIGGFYYNRWGDAPFRWLGLRLFSSTDKIWFAQETTNYCYQHGSLVVGIDKLDPECLSLIPDVFRRMLNR